MFSIDQNCHPLWDVVPKCQALALRGGAITHFIEDVDVAFTAIGAADDQPLRLAKERHYYRGGADWGAAVFYSEFLGRLPVDVSVFEPLTGRKTSVLARELGATPEALYDRYSPGDNWQLIGPSYVGDRDHHRLIGDLTVAETAPFLHEILDKCEADLLARFPAPESIQRCRHWLAFQRSSLADLLTRHAADALPALYESWLRTCLDRHVGLDRTRNLFALAASPAQTKLLERFTVDYAAAAALYNQAIAESGQPLRPLDIDAGELPFFAAVTHEGHFCRTAVHLEGNALRIGPREVRLSPDRRLDLQALRAVGVQCLAGKAILLVIQARILPGGAPLAVPYRGSTYLPAAHRLADLLAEHDMLPGPLAPIRRVRLRLLDRMAGLDTPIALPAHLAGAFGAGELPAKRLAESWQDISSEASRRIEQFTDEDQREAYCREAMSDLVAQADGLDARRRTLAAEDPKNPELRAIGKAHKAVRREILAGLVDRIATDQQLAALDYWDSRGAIWPWCLAVGGEGFYRDVLARAEVYDEPDDRAEAIRGHYRPRISEDRPHFNVLDWADAEGQNARFAALADNVDLAGRTLLDVGCGLGDLLAWLNERGVDCSYTGVDIVPEMVAAARRHHPGVEFLCGDVFADPPAIGRTFDVVFCSGTFNLDLGNAAEFLARAVERLLRLTGHTLAFNLLHERTESQYDQCVYHDPADVLEMLATHDLTAHVIDDYLPNDFTVICHK